MYQIYVAKNNTYILTTNPFIGRSLWDMNIKELFTTYSIGGSNSSLLEKYIKRNKVKLLIEFDELNLNKLKKEHPELFI
ncbi:MAG: hypothetical protein BV457_06445 [Thermoplasmata archaeon M9B1D]|nr:MAG: hypothetical protein BV457_06445 [Thermoplasmata archaeon M9B1D]PNX48210.1 MAG: hypothetical protein BV456_10010 [Thermoplasmata archaeon M8B2D]